MQEQALHVLFLFSFCTFLCRSVKAEQNSLNPDYVQPYLKNIQEIKRQRATFTNPAVNLSKRR